MPFPFTCPSCRHTSQVLDRLAGTQAKCPSCGVVVRIPHGPQAAITPVVPAVAPVVEPAPASPPPRPAQPRNSGGMGMGIGFAVFALIAVVFGLLCCGGGLFILYWLGRDGISDPRAFAAGADSRSAPAENTARPRSSRGDPPKSTNAAAPRQPGNAPPSERGGINWEDDRVEYLVQVMVSGWPADAETARTRLLQNGRGAVFELRKFLRRPETNAKTRLMVIAVLGELRENSTDAIEDLGNELKNIDAQVRLAAAQALGKIGPPSTRVMPALIQATADSNEAVASAAEDTLKRIGPPTGSNVDKLADLWKEPSPDKRQKYLAAILRLKSDSKLVIPLMAQLLSDASPAIRLQAITELGKTGPAAHAEAFGKLLLTLDDQDADLRKAGLTALAQIGPATPAKRKDLEGGLRGKYPEFRLYCAEQLGNFGVEAKASVPDIARLLRDEDARVRVAAAKALGRIGTPALVVLDDLLGARQDSDAAVRKAAIETLGGFGRQKGIVAALLDAFNDSDKGVRDAAVAALRSLKPPLGAEDQPLLAKALKSPVVEARRFAAGEFARLGKGAPDGLPVVMEAVKDPDNEVRRQAFAALAAYGPAAKSAVPVLVETMTAVIDSDAAQDGALELFRQASVTLTKIADATPAIPVWRKGLKAKNVAVRKEVIQSLGEVGPPARVAAHELCKQLETSELAEAAGKAVLKIGGDEVVRELADVVDEGANTQARLAAIRLLGEMGPLAKKFGFQALSKAARGDRGKDLVDPANEALRLVTRQ